MKKNFAFGISFVLALAALTFFSSNVSAQGPLLVEDFNYGAGSLLINNNWTAHSGAGTNQIAVSEPGLTLAGYPSSGVGNAVTLALTGEDVNRPFTTQTTGSVYAAFMVTVSEASVDPAGGYFFHLGPDPVGTTFRGRVFAKKDASNNVAFGISKAATAAADIVFTPFSYSLNTTYLIVVKYTIVDGTNNDTVSMIVSTTVPANEPAATVTASDVATQTDVNPGTVSLRQGATATSPTVRVDGIRIGTTWASITQAAAPVQAPIDFNGDGKTDYAVVRNTGGGANGQVTWFVNQNGSANNTVTPWGIASDFFVPLDYDGDGKTDVAVWRAGAPFAAAFYILQSSNNTLRVDVFGQSLDDPSVTGDYDGDGKDDPAIYRPGANSGDPSFWAFRASTTGVINIRQWGQAGDFPAPGDYDGDGKYDLAVQRNGGGGQARFWFYLSGTSSISSTVFGTPTDTIVPGDYDGDGKTDIAVTRSSGSALVWSYLPSSDGSFVSFIWGSSSTDFTAQGDYDGDGKTDAAVWRPSADPAATYFYARGSSNGGLFLTEWGQTGDYPIANYNRH